jgi:hypothetical protein
MDPERRSLTQKLLGVVEKREFNQWSFQDPVPYKAIFWGYIPLHRPYIGQ